MSTTRSTLQQNLPPMELQTPSRADASAETPRKSLKDWNEIPARALGRAGLSQKAAAIAMDKSESWLSRALKGLEKLGWCDVGMIDDPAFWAELLQLMAEYHGVAFGGNEQARADADVGRRVRELFTAIAR
jgi:hypothetical protein